MIETSPKSYHQVIINGRNLLKQPNKKFLLVKSEKQTQLKILLPTYKDFSNQLRLTFEGGEVGRIEQEVTVKKQKLLIKRRNKDKLTVLSTFCQKFRMKREKKRIENKSSESKLKAFVRLRVEFSR